LSLNSEDTEFNENHQSHFSESYDSFQLQTFHNKSSVFYFDIDTLWLSG